MHVRTLIALIALPALLSASPAPLVAPPPVPANFQAQVIDGGDKVRLTWSSPAPQVRVFVQKQVLKPNGTYVWETQLGSASLGELAYPRNMINTGQHVVNTHATTLGVFRFFLKAKDGSSYSAETPKLVRTGLH